MTAQFIGYNNKDMDFNVLMQRMRIAVYNRYNIPLPMVEGEFTSNSNMKESDLQFYNKAVLPLVNKTAQRFLKIYKTFYTDDVVEFGFEKSSIPSLQEAMIRNAGEMDKNRSITQNEVREYLGIDRVKGADTLYMDANSIPVGGDTNFKDSLGVTLRESTTPQ